MLTREELNMLNVENLRKYASSIKVKKIRTYKKPELIEEVIRVQHEIEEEFGTDEELRALKVECEKEKEVEDVVEAVEKDNNDCDDIDSKRLSYIENAPVGTIVAFKIGTKVKSAMIVNRSSGRKKLKLETAYGKVFVVDYSDILWVRTSKRWPKGIYQLFGKNKAVNTDGKEG